MAILIPANGLWTHTKTGRIYRVLECKALYQSSVAEALDGTTSVRYRMARLDELLLCFPPTGWPTAIRPDAVGVEGLDLEFDRQIDEFVEKFAPMTTADLARVILAAGTPSEGPENPPDLVGEESIG